MKMREVYSSRVARIGYEDGVLRVEWVKAGKNGGVSVFSDVPPKLADQVMNAPSIGQALRLSIEGQFPHGYE